MSERVLYGAATVAEPLITIVVPCYNEARRLAVERFRAFAGEHPNISFLFVDDGSTDATAEMIQALVSANPQRFSLLSQPKNQGKAEAVRSGMLKALETGATYAGYWDADLATPLAEIPRFVDVLERHRERDICFGARVRLLGRSIERRALRHYLGRAFATVASLVLDLPIYDTQCGAKLFRVLHETRALFAERFCVNWTFDVEVIARVQSLRLESRLANDLTPIYELPLDEWRDVAGSKVKPSDFLRGLLEIVRIYRKYGRGGRTERRRLSRV
jgi:glycosyltransferase involved in cell wall biosynthesis